MNETINPAAKEQNAPCTCQCESKPASTPAQPQPAVAAAAPATPKAPKASKRARKH